MSVLNYLKYPDGKSYGLSKCLLGLIIYLASIAALIIRILSQFNKNGEKQDIIVTSVFLALLISSMSIVMSIISLHRLLKNKEYRKDTRKIRIISYSIALVSSIATITVEVVSLTNSFSTFQKEANDVNFNTIFSFAGTLMSIFIFYPIAIYCKHHDYKSSKIQEEQTKCEEERKKYKKEQKKHKTIIAILSAILVLDLITIASKIINFLERKGNFIIEDTIYNLGNNVTYYFNFSATIGIACAIITLFLRGFRIPIEKNSKVSDTHVTQGLEQQPEGSFHNNPDIPI